MEQTQNAGIGVGAQNGTDHAGHNVFHSVILSQDVLQRGSILGTVTMGNGDQIVTLRTVCFLKFPGKQADGGLSAPGFSTADKLSLVRNSDNRLDIQHGSDKCGCGIQSAAAFQVCQIVHRDPVAHSAGMLIQPGSVFFQRCAAVPESAGMPHQKAFAQRTAETVHDADVLRG